ncbi:hypothetical protein Y1Q_0000135 [Alligator mississippiensis]|uniref:Uncharacterized protein n=1 Tax=Alligator mississippiensis TaxID=8496 RepID=A0A151MLP3_ALLMI|nr:hypothetical protein Y1Q_0000135 [Alligator mississippiensis]
MWDLRRRSSQLFEHLAFHTSKPLIYTSKTSTSLALAVIYCPLRSLPVMSPAEARKQMTETNTFTQEPALGELFLLPLYPKEFSYPQPLCDPIYPDSLATAAS